MMKIQIYSKWELAKLYFPNQSQHVAVNHLMRMIKRCKPLIQALKWEGYTARCKTFSTRMTLLIYEYLGEP